MTLTPLIKGFITSAVMLGVTLALFYSKVPAGSRLHYSVFVIYAAGILWAALDYARSPAYTGHFGNIFGQCFRCFIIVTLVMVVFTGIFSMMHPEFAAEDAKGYREYLIKEEKSKTPAEVETLVKEYKNNYTVKNIRQATFGYLMTGALFSVGAASLVLLIRRKN